jgi:hypothetical protein
MNLVGVFLLAFILCRMMGIRDGLEWDLEKWIVF